MTAKRIYIATATFGQTDRSVFDLLRAHRFEYHINNLGRTLRPSEMREKMGSCVGVVAGLEPYTSETLPGLPELRVISRCGVGMENIDLRLCQARGIDVCSTPEGPTQAVAELTLALVLNLLRHVSVADHNLRTGLWARQTGFLLSEVIVGVLGLGRIGRRLAEMVRSLGGHVLGADLRINQEWCRRHEIHTCSRSELIEKCDVLCLHLPMAEDLRHVIGEAQMASMKKGSFLVNTARGELVDEFALARAIDSGHLAGAALDVFEREPYEGILKDNKNVILTPHIGSYARAARETMEREAVANLLSALEKL